MLHWAYCYELHKQVRIQDLCKGGGANEILLTSRSGVAVTAKIWASNLGVGGNPPPHPPPDPLLDTFGSDLEYYNSRANI